MFYHTARLTQIFIVLFCALTATPSKSEDSSGKDFENWVERLKIQAISKGISAQTVQSSLQSLKPMNYVADFNAEIGNFFFDQYLSMALSEQQKHYQTQLLNHYSNILFEISHLFGVEPELLIAIWALDNINSQQRKKLPVIPLLVSSSYHQPKNTRILKELFSALKLVDQKQVNPSTFTSDENGLLGTILFSPSILLSHGIDYDGDGQINVWSNYADIFASMANYLSIIGWKNKERWGMEVILPEGMSISSIDEAVQRPVNYWHTLGMRQINGADLPLDANLSSLIKPDPFSDRTVIALENYFVLLRWKRSHAFGLGVALCFDNLRQNKEREDTPSTPFLTP